MLVRLHFVIAFVFCTMCHPSLSLADDATLREEIALLNDFVLELQTSRKRILEAKGCRPVVDEAQRTTTRLVAKLAKQQENMARVVLGLAPGPLQIPETILSEKVPNEYIVLTAQPTSNIEARYNINPEQVLYRYDQAITGFAATLSEAERTRLLADPDVVSIVENGRVFVSGWAGETPEIFQRQSEQSAPPFDPKVDVFLFDTGIRAAHHDLENRVAVSGFSTFDNGIATNDCSGHGTHSAARIAGQSLGVTPSAQLFSVKVMDAFGGGDEATVIAGIDWLMLQPAPRPRIANMSLTRLAGNDVGPMDMAVNALIDSGVTVVVAAGNSSQDASRFSPARVERAITVGSVGPSGLSAFSNAGAGVDIYAPGEEIASASIRNVCELALMSGTSMSAPFVTGLMAKELAEGKTHEAAWNSVKKQARSVETGAFSGETQRLILSDNAAETAIEICAGR